MVINNFSELLINVAYDLNKNNATLELNFMEMGEFIDKYLIIHLDKDILKRINFKHKYIISKGDYIESLNYNNLLKLLLLPPYAFANACIVLAVVFWVAHVGTFDVV